MKKYIGSETKRAFQQRKRREFAALMKAADTFFFGCGYLPANASIKFGHARAELDQLHKELKLWWRKA